LNPYKNYKLNVVTRIENRNVKKGDTTITEPFKVFKISQVNILTNSRDNEIEKQSDSATYKDYNIYSLGKLNYKPNALANATFINKGDLYSDDKRKLTSTAFN